MADVQALFEKFHQKIMTYYEINSTLREKKDIIVNRLNANLKKNGRPSCTVFLQGSYKMKIGICAVAGLEYDIDVGLRFAFKESDHAATEVRSWVFEALKDHTEKVEEKASCVRVSYADGYHVDLVSYARWSDLFGVEQHRLAHQSRGWCPADPPALVKHVKDARAPFGDTKDGSTQTDQFRRVVRYLKRWNDVAKPYESKDKPSGIALVLLSEKHLPAPVLSWDGPPDDRRALEQIATAAASTYGRIVISKPTSEFEDLFAGISLQEMIELKNRFAALREALVDAKNAKSSQEACKRLKGVFGEDFPCPEADGGDKAAARKTSAPAVIPSTSSASQ